MVFIRRAGYDDVIQFALRERDASENLLYRTLPNRRSRRDTEYQLAITIKSFVSVYDKQSFRNIVKFNLVISLCKIYFGKLFTTG